MFVVYSSPTIDGISAAAIILRYARLFKHEAKIGGFLAFSDAQKTFEDMTKQDKSIIFIADFPPDQVQQLEPTLKEISTHNRIAYWNSSQKTSARAKEIVSKYARKTDFSEKCSAELAMTTLLPQDSVAREIAAIAHDYTSWLRKDARSQQLNDIINAGFDKKELADMLSRGVFSSPRFSGILNTYSEKKKQALNALMGSLLIKKYLTHSFGYVLADNHIPSAEAGEYLLSKHSGIDVAVLLYRDGRIIIRKRDSIPVDASQIARNFRGGGHSYAAGGIIPEMKSITNDSYERAVFIADRIMKDFFLRF